MNESQKIENIYKWQVLFYDFCRKYYLFGRDNLIQNLNLTQERVCEVGFGTGRNLIKIAKKYPGSRLYGIDISESMLNFAQKNINKNNLHNQIFLHKLNASTSDYATVGTFDKILFIYSLSMISNPISALESAFNALKIGGEICVVDFSSSSKFPKILHFIHHKWLELFSVRYKPEILMFFQKLTESGKGTLEYSLSVGNYYETLIFKKVNNANTI